MRYVLVFLCCLPGMNSFAQNSGSLDILIRVRNVEDSSPASFDTIFLNSDYKHTITFYTDIDKKDSIFKIPNIAPGKYWLKLFSSNFYISPLPITVCSKCTDQFEIFAHPLKDGESRMTFEMVEISPAYFGGYSALAQDFQRALSKRKKSYSGRVQTSPFIFSLPKKNL